MEKNKLKCDAQRAAWPSRILPSALVMACLVLAGCGGGGGASGGTNSSSLSGKVIDGYIEGAEVCLDVNANQLCDGTEPRTVSAKDGSYKLDTTGLTSDQIKAAHLLTTVSLKAKDADDAGMTLEEAGKSAFNLLAPAAAYVNASGTDITGAIISPLTTLVSHNMITNNTPLATAQGHVRDRLSLAQGTDLNQDFVAKNDKQLMGKAQMLAAAIGEVKAQALADTTSKPSDKEAFFAALQYLQTQVADLQKAVDAAKAINSSAKSLDLVKTAVATEAAKPVVADLISEAKKTTDSTAVSSVVAVLEQGIYGGEHVLEPCGFLSANDSGYCTPVYWKIQGSGGKVSDDNNYRLAGNTWTKDLDSGQNEWTLASDGWKQQNNCPANQSHTYSVGAEGVTTIKFCSGLTERVTAREVDASGKTLASLGLRPPTDYESTTLPAGSKLYWFDFANLEDKVYLYTDSAPEQFVNIQGKDGLVPYTSLNEFISVNQTPTDNVSSRFMGWSGLSFSFDAGGTKTGGNLTLWDFVKGRPTKTGGATYEIRTIHQNDVLIINAKAPENRPGLRIMFAVKDGKVYGGSFQSVSSQGSSNPIFNKTMMNAILAAGKKPAVLD